MTRWHVESRLTSHGTCVHNTLYSFYINQNMCPYMWIVLWIMLQMTAGNSGKCGKSVKRDQQPVQKKSRKVYTTIRNWFLVTLHRFPAFSISSHCHLEHNWQHHSHIICPHSTPRAMCMPFLLKFISQVAGQPTMVWRFNNGSCLSATTLSAHYSKETSKTCFTRSNQLFPSKLILLPLAIWVILESVLLHKDCPIISVSNSMDVLSKRSDSRKTFMKPSRYRIFQTSKLMQLFTLSCFREVPFYRILLILIAL